MPYTTPTTSIQPPFLHPNAEPNCRVAAQNCGHRRARKYQSTANQKPAPPTTTAAPWPRSTAEPHQPKTKGRSTTPEGGCRNVPVLLTADEGARVPPPPGRHNLTATNQPAWGLQTRRTGSWLAFGHSQPSKPPQEGTSGVSDFHAFAKQAIIAYTCIYDQSCPIAAREEGCALGYDRTSCRESFIDSSFIYTFLGQRLPLDSAIDLYNGLYHFAQQPLFYYFLPRILDYNTRSTKLFSWVQGFWAQPVSVKPTGTVVGTEPPRRGSNLAALGWARRNSIR